MSVGTPKSGRGVHMDKRGETILDKDKAGKE